jgi:hypothetical protein
MAGEEEQLGFRRPYAERRERQHRGEAASSATAGARSRCSVAGDAHRRSAASQGRRHRRSRRGREGAAARVGRERPGGDRQRSDCATRAVGEGGREECSRSRAEGRAKLSSPYLRKERGKGKSERGPALFLEGSRKGTIGGGGLDPGDIFLGNTYVHAVVNSNIRTDGFFSW